MKPCKHETSQDGCRVCHLYDRDPRYQRLWGKPAKPNYFASAMSDKERAKLYDLLRRVDAALQDTQYVLCWGGLLGFVRNGEMMRWDDDLDLLALDPPSVEELQRRLPDLKVLDGKYIKIFDPTDPRIGNHEHSFPFIELNPAYLDTDHVCTKSAFGLPDDRFPMSMVFPAQRQQFGPVECNLPAQPTELALLKYGPAIFDSAKPPYWSHKHERRTGFPQDRVPLSDIAPPSEVQRSYLINLKRRPDRLEHAMMEFDKAGIEPHVIEAVDGRALPTPVKWKDGAGAYGCLESHKRVLEDAIMNKFRCVAVYEDDVVFSADYTTKLHDLLGRLPEDWDCVFVGGQHRKTPRPVKEGLVRCVDCHRTHGYIVRGQYIQRLYQIWASNYGHADHIWGRYQHEANVYAADPWLAGQGENKSDINGRTEGERWWTSAKKPCLACGKKIPPRAR